MKNRSNPQLYIGTFLLGYEHVSLFAWVGETGHDALCGFYFNGKKWTVSLYHAKHRTDLDLSKIAVKYGGGGHRGACGFTTEIFPFTTAP